MMAGNWIRWLAGCLCRLAWLGMRSAPTLLFVVLYSLVFRFDIGNDIWVRLMLDESLLFLSFNAIVDME